MFNFHHKCAFSSPFHFPPFQSVGDAPILYAYAHACDGFVHANEE